MVPTLLTRTLLSSLAIGLSACMVGPDFRPIKVKVPERWQKEMRNSKRVEWLEVTPSAMQKSATDRPEELLTSIWKDVFDDSDLLQLLETVETQNLELQVALENAIRAEQQITLAQSNGLPSLTLEPSAQRRGTSGSARAAAGTFPRRTFNSFFFSSLSSWEIDLWGRVRRSIEAADAASLAAHLSKDELLVSLKAEAARLYYAARTIASAQEIFARSVGLRQESLSLARARFNAGETDSLDVERATADLAETRVRMHEQQRLAEENLLRLQALMGATSDQWLPTILPIERNSLAIPATVPSEVLLHRPDVRAAQQRVRAANAGIGIATAAFFPRLAISGSAGYQSARDSDLFRSPSRIWSLGPDLTLPLFQGGRNVANLASSEAEYRATVAAYKSTVVNALVEVEGALLNISSYAEQLSEQERVVHAAQAARRLSQRRYQIGLVSFLEVLDAQRTELGAELDYADLLGRYYGASVDMIRAIGGSWNSRGHTE